MSKPSKLKETLKGIGFSLAGTGIGVIASGEHIIGIACTVLGIAVVVYTQYKEQIQKAIEQ